MNSHEIGGTNNTISKYFSSMSFMAIYVLSCQE